MHYVQFTEQDQAGMLKTIGVGSIAELYRDIPAEYRVRGELDLPPPLSELELLDDLAGLARHNASCAELICFLGCGAYDHFVPTVVDALSGQNGFLTGYTPYQAEASQGALQVFFEFQTMVCQLTGMDIANASLYEMSTALVEAVLIARQVTRRPNVVACRGLHPDNERVLHTYLAGEPFEFRQVPAPQGVVTPEALQAAVDETTAAVIIQQPNFFGLIQPLDVLAPLVRQAGALLIVVMDPLSAGVLKRPGELGADIVVAEGQPLGVPLSYGGPYLGLFACRAEFLRRVPGRLIGQTVDAEGRRGFCMTLQTREQHIRRERATSNICTNQGLLATRAAIYMAAVGQRGIRQIAELCLHKAHYAAERIAALPGYALRFDRPFFKEFVVRSDRPVDAVLAHARSRGVLAGVALGRWFDDLQDCFAVAVTEKRSKAEIDALVEALAGVP